MVLEPGQTVFLFGTGLLPEMSAALGLGAGQAASVSGFVAGSAGDWRGASLVAQPGGALFGQLVDLAAEDAARFAFVMDVLGAEPVAVMIGEQAATAYSWPGGAEAWAPEAWQASWGATMARLTADILGFYGVRDVPSLQGSLGQMQLRAASWARARANPTPMQWRSGLRSNDVDSGALRRPYLDYFMLEEQDVSFAHFQGGKSAPVQRAALALGDAVTLLPYDPVRDRVLLVEQFRFGPLVRGDLHPWSLEPIAGRIDPGETPEETAEREAMEEVGLALDRLEFIARYYPSPGAVSEYIYSYIALADLPESAARIGGLESEAEDIRGLLLSYDELQALVASGEAENGPLLLSALWLGANRDRLRRSA